MRETSGTRAREAPASACQAVKRTEPCRANLAPERQEDLAGPQRRGGGDEGGGWGGHAAPADRDRHTLGSGPDADAGPALRLPLQMPETRLRHARGQAESKTLSSVVGRTRDSPRSCLAVCLAQSLGLQAGWTHPGVRPFVRTARVEERMSPLVGLTCSG